MSKIWFVNAAKVRKKLVVPLVPRFFLSVVPERFRRNVEVVTKSDAQTSPRNRSCVSWWLAVKKNGYLLRFF